MSRSNMRIVETITGLIEWRDRSTDVVILAVNPDDITDTDMRRKVFNYGVKQIVSDGAASVTGRTQKADHMTARFNSIVDGTWGMRKSASFANAALYAAGVAIGLWPDDADRREKFTKLPPAAVATLYARPDIASWLENNTDAAVAESLDEMLA